MKKPFYRYQFKFVNLGWYRVLLVYRSDCIVNICIYTINLNAAITHIHGEMNL